MNVGIVVQNEYPHVGLVRPRRLARSLRRAGHHVFFLSRNTGKLPSCEESADGRIYRFPYFLGTPLYPVASVLFPLNPLWLWWIYKVGRVEKPDIWIASNLRPALPTILAGWLQGSRTVMDLEENNPEAVKFYPKSRPWHYLLRNSWFVWALESLCALLSDHVWVVVEERKADMPRRVQRRRTVSVLGHPPSLEEVLDARADCRPRNEVFTMAYVGLFAPGIGSIEPFLEAMPYVLARDPNVHLRIAGGRQLEPLVQRLGIADHVCFDGMIPPEQLTEWLQQADVGLIGYRVARFTNTTVSNKLFHYMAAGLPVLSTAMIPTRRIIEQTGCGRVIPEGAGPEEIAQIILEMKQQTAARATMGERGRQAILESFNWEREFEQALATLERLALNPRRAAALRLGETAPPER